MSESVSPPQSAPEWFTQAITTPKESAVITVADCPIHYQCWGDKGRPGLILVHGNGAHVGWWDFIAPFFIDRYRVAAFDLSGMGDSGHRPHYTSELYVEEIMTVSAAADISGLPILLGHSFGGRLVLKAGLLRGDDVAGIIMADSPFRTGPPRVDFSRRRQEGVKPKNIYPTYEAARARFRLNPGQPCDNDYIVDYIAKGSIHQTAEGWTWKFDEKLWATFEYEKLFRDTLTKETKLWGFIYGEHSILFPERVENYSRELVQSTTDADIICIPNAHHHLFLDQPLAFVDAVNKVLAAHYSLD